MAHHTSCLRINMGRGCFVLIRTSDLGTRDVINVRDGRRLGLVSDYEIDFEEGAITAIIVPARNGWLWFLHREDYVIPWDRIVKIGVDIILVELDEEKHSNVKNRHKHLRAHKFKAWNKPHTMWK